MTTRPEQITGGCLCGSIRYAITFPEDASWPADVWNDHSLNNNTMLTITDLLVPMHHLPEVHRLADLSRSHLETASAQRYHQGLKLQRIPV